MDILGYKNLAERARGATAVVYDLADGRVLKLFNEGYWRKSAFREYENARVLGELNVPAARGLAFLEDAGRYGIVYECIEGPSLLSALFSGGDLAVLGAEFAALHRKILSARTTQVASLKRAWRESAERGGAGEWARLIDLLPDGDSLCHGDYHPFNVILSPDGARVIDFMNVCSGHPMCDIARTVYLIECAPAEGISADFRRALTDVYLSGMGVSRGEVAPFLPAVMAARMGEDRTPVETAYLRAELSKVRFC